LEDEKDPNIKHKIIVDERVNLLDALKNKGVTKNKEGLRLYNQKYYLSNYDAELSHCYYKKVNVLLFSQKEELAFVRLKNSF
jgi:hypothetical protein